MHYRYGIWHTWYALQVCTAGMHCTVLYITTLQVWHTWYALQVCTTGMHCTVLYITTLQVCIVPCYTLQYTTTQLVALTLQHITTQWYKSVVMHCTVSMMWWMLQSCFSKLNKIRGVFLSQTLHFVCSVSMWCVLQCEYMMRWILDFEVFSDSLPNESYPTENSCRPNARFIWREDLERELVLVFLLLLFNFYLIFFLHLARGPRARACAGIPPLWMRVCGLIERVCVLMFASSCAWVRVLHVLGNGLEAHRASHLCMYTQIEWDLTSWLYISDIRMNVRFTWVINNNLLSHSECIYLSDPIILSRFRFD